MWIATNDFTKELRKTDINGKTQFMLIVDSSGHVTDCKINGSSGAPELDALTCKLVSRRARLQPATDQTGQPVTSQYVDRVWWVNHAR